MTQHPGTFIIAEIALAHDGSLGASHAYIDAAARAGANAVKFQTHLAHAESSLAEPWRIKFSAQDSTRFDYWQRTAFTEEQWKGLRDHAIARGIEFLSSPFSVESAEMLTRVGVSSWKIASGETSNPQLLDFVRQTGMPVMLSTGMSPLEEIDSAVERIRRCDVPLTVMQCTSAYPCPPEKVGLNLLNTFRERYGCAVGLSDHSGTIFPCLAAATLGADVLEIHVTFSRECFGPDVPASITTAELRQLVEGVRFIDRMMVSPVDKDLASQEADGLRSIFTRSVVLSADLPAGTVLQAAHLTTRKPGTGIPPRELPRLIGRVLKQSVRAGEFLNDNNLMSESVSAAG
jgi:N-acetylneuraminate synthase